ncbi:MAG: galactokinase [Actinomycetes bacterium]
MTQWLDAPPTDDVVPSLQALFARAFGTGSEGVWSAPGRVNLIGEHVDYNGGPCLPVALSHRTRVAVARRDDDVVRVVSAQEPDGWAGRLDDVGPGSPPGWPAYAAGVLWSLRRSGIDVPGLDVAVDGAVPLGAGLSSSAALECAVAVAVADLIGLPLDDDGRRDLAAVCVRAENVVAGAPTGGMDQAVSLRARDGHALLLDTADHSVRHVPLDLPGHGLRLLVVDTRAPHRLVDGQYAERRAACERAAAALGVTRLAELPPDADLSPLDDLTRRRVRHVLSEVARVHEVVALLDAGRVEDVGPLLDASHASLRDDYEVSCAELDVAVEAARDAGALGARMTGGGFGGSAVALVPASSLEAVAAHVAAAFSAAGFSAPAFLVATPSPGATRDTPTP